MEGKDKFILPLMRNVILLKSERLVKINIFLGICCKGHSKTLKYVTRFEKDYGILKVHHKYFSVENNNINC
jgi:hypothetical protein